ncbi:MAG: HAD family phosphatase [Candidatus Omnitrophica bacterium]|nr:HAD family phosphatase [Candidatus Omnitrophota bacterium]
MKRKTMHKFSTVIFDMDGVITNTMPYHFEAWQRIFSALGIKVNRCDIYKREGQDGLTSVKEILRQYNHKFSVTEAREILAAKERLFKKIVRIRFVKGSRSFVRALKRRGFRLALVTGTSRQEAEKILPFSLLRLFDATVTGDEVKYGKPHPEPFLKALKMLGVVSGEALVIENAPFGITAAKRAGLFCVALETSLPGSYLKDSDRAFKTFKDLERAICFSRKKEV